jgi:hypothetical protein
MFQSEVDEISEASLPKKIHEAVRGIRSFIVVDDLDSIPPDEQKRAIEVCQSMVSTGTRILFTTRKNATASSASAIELEGFSLNDFTLFVDGWTERLKLPALSPAQTKKMHTLTRGSPLYAESFLRLLKIGVKFADAFNSWGGKLGNDVRKAALEREVKQLSQEARKLIVAASARGEASYAELKELTNYSDQTLGDCIVELQSLFLLSAPKIAKQQRFHVPQTTRELVFSLNKDLIPDFDTFTEEIKKRQYKPSKKINEKTSLIGAAVNQALSLLRQGNADGALQTINEVTNSFKEKNPDLLFLKGRVLTQIIPLEWSKIRDIYREAYDCGQKKDQFFDFWYAAEMSDSHYEGAIEVCIKAITDDAGEKSQWLKKRAAARHSLSIAHESAGDRTHALTELKSAVSDLVEMRELNKSIAFEDSSPIELVHDKQWKILSATTSATEWLDVIDAQLEAIQNGDKRIEIYERLVVSLHQLNDGFRRQPDGTTSRQAGLIELQAKRVLAALKGASSVLQKSSRFKDTLRLLEQLGS